MTISRTIAIALVGLSIGFTATSANAGILGDIVGGVANKVVKVPAVQQQKGSTTSSGGAGVGRNFAGYINCVGYVNALAPGDAARQARGERQCAKNFPN